MEVVPRKGDWIQTYTGRQYWPLDPHHRDVSIIDIAHALSMTGRFSGHTRFFYSVAQHSVLGSELIEPEYAFEFLMHDSPEAYVADIARPVKRNIVGYDEIEMLNWVSIAKKFGLSVKMSEATKRMDNMMLVAEKQQIMRKTTHEWSIAEPPADVVIEPWTPEYAKMRFLERFLELNGH